jgi:hypothetical protein
MNDRAIISSSILDRVLAVEAIRVDADGEH